MTVPTDRAPTPMAASGDRAPDDVAPDDRIPAAVWRIAAVVVFGAFMAGLDTSLVNVGLATIAHDLHGSLSSAQWVSSGYLIALAAALPGCSWLSRRIGAGRLWLFALTGFTVCSALCAVAPSLPILIALRALQGATGGLLVPSGQTVLGRAAGPRRMGRVMNTAGIAVVLAPAIGPTVGGLLIASLSWRWLFLVNVPVGVVALALGARMLPRGEPDHDARPDGLGLRLLVAGLPLVSYGIIAASRAGGLDSVSALVALGLGGLALAAFGLHARRADATRPPALDLSLFARRDYAAAQISVLFCGASLFGGLIVLPLYYELLRGEGVVATGLLLLAYGGGAAISMRLGGRLTDRIGGGRTAAAGLLITILATVPFIMLDAHVSLIVVEVLQCARGVGVSLAGLPAMSSAYAAVSADELPDATVQANILQRVGGSLGSALFVVILDAHHPLGLAAFHSVFTWLSVTAGLALVAAVWLAREQRR